MCAPTKRITPRLRRRGGCPHPPADHGECSANVRAGEDTGPYGICGSLFKHRRGGSQTRPRAHTARPYEEYGGFPVYRKGRGLAPPADGGKSSADKRADEDLGPESMVRRGGCPHPPADHGECSVNVRAGEDTGPYGICKISCFAVGAAHLGRPRDTFISRPGAGRPYPRSSSAAPPGRAPPSPPAWGPPPRGPGPAASR